MTLLAPSRSSGPPPAGPPRRRSPAARRAGAAAALAAVGLAVAACAGPAGHPHADARPGARRLSAGAGRAGASPGPARSATPHPPPSVVPPTTPAARPTASSRPARAPAAPTAAAPAPGPSVTGAASPPPLAACATSGLRVSIGPPGSTAGSNFYPVQFTNVTAGPCTLYGYPGVSLVSAPGGRQLGAAAVRDAGPGPAVVVLAPGAVAHAALQVTVAQNYPASVCRPVTARWLQVYPPGQYAPAYARLTATTCAGTVPGGSTLGIFVVRPGANGA
jgi:hypothetical protein